MNERKSKDFRLLKRREELRKSPIFPDRFVKNSHRLLNYEKTTSLAKARQ